MDQIQEIPLDKITPSPYQPRKKANAEDVEDLVASIKSSGLLTPIQVRKKGKGYELLAGERRWRAFQVLKRKNIPAIVRDISDFEAMEMAAAENWVRKDLTAPEREEIIGKLWEVGKKEGRYTSEDQLAAVLGYADASSIAEHLRAFNVRTITKCPDKLSTRLLSAISYLPKKYWDDAISKVLSDDKTEQHKMVTYLRSISATDEKTISHSIKPDAPISPEQAIQIMGVSGATGIKEMTEAYSVSVSDVRKEDPVEVARVISKPEAQPIKDMVLSVKSPIAPKVADVLMEIQDPKEMRRTAQLVVDRNLPADDVRKAVEVVKSAPSKVKEMFFSTELKTPEEAQIATHFADEKVLDMAVAYIKSEEDRIGRKLTGDERKEVLRLNVSVTTDDIDTARKEGEEIAQARTDLIKGYIEWREQMRKEMGDDMRTPEGKERQKHIASNDFHSHMEGVIKAHYDFDGEQWMRDLSSESIRCPHCGKHGREYIGWICCGTPFDEAIAIDKKSFKEWNDKDVAEARKKRKEARK